MRQLQSFARFVGAVMTLFTCFFVASPESLGRLDETRLAAAYLAAYGLGDEVTAERVASPLYAAEWARRGVSVARRQALLPHLMTSDNRPAPWLRFRYVGGAIDGSGFGHLLYLASSTLDSGCASPTVWRVDTEPGGRVIWSELVWSFSCDATSISIEQPVRTRDGLEPVLVVGVRAKADHSGYYVIQPHISSGSNLAGVVFFYGVDAQGIVRPGSWSYGRREPGPSIYGAKHEEKSISLDASQQALRAAYMTALCGGCR
jgi:hypothetical protein